jgi:hypothetical protein
LESHNSKFLRRFRREKKSDGREREWRAVAYEEIIVWAHPCGLVWCRGVGGGVDQELNKSRSAGNVDEARDVGDGGVWTRQVIFNLGLLELFEWIKPNAIAI